MEDQDEDKVVYMDQSVRNQMEQSENTRAIMYVGQRVKVPGKYTRGHVMSKENDMLTIKFDLSNKNVGFIGITVSFPFSALLFLLPPTEEENPSHTARATGVYETSSHRMTLLVRDKIGTFYADDVLCKILFKKMHKC